MIGSLEIKRIGRIKAPDLFGSTIEVTRGVKIAWNRLWIESQKPESIEQSSLE